MCSWGTVSWGAVLCTAATCGMAAGPGVVRAGKGTITVWTGLGAMVVATGAGTGVGAGSGVGVGVGSGVSVGAGVGVGVGVSTGVGVGMSTGVGIGGMGPSSSSEVGVGTGVGSAWPGACRVLSWPPPAVALTVLPSGLTTESGAGAEVAPTPSTAAAVPDKAAPAPARTKADIATRTGQDQARLGRSLCFGLRFTFPVPFEA
jgi:hypothetical protein